MIAYKPASSAVAGLRTRLPASPAAAAAGLSANGRRSVVVRFKEEDKRTVDLEQLEKQMQAQKADAKTPKLSQEEIEELRYKNPGGKTYYPTSELTPRTADMRADLGTAAGGRNAWQLQAFDGPAPETINSRLAMLGVLVGLVGEWKTGLGLMQQTADHPLIVFGSFLLLAFASYVPLARGYTRKEPFANHLVGFNWTPRAENWNGRIAMLGFAGMVLTEWITGVNTLQAWGLQHIPFNAIGM